MVSVYRNWHIKIYSKQQGHTLAIKVQMLPRIILLLIFHIKENL